MTQNFANLTLDETVDVVVKIQEAGYDKIRCALTGQVIAEILPAVLSSAVSYMRFEQPLITDNQIVDLMQIRWLVQCSRPAPHLVSFQSHDAHTYLVNNHPRDIFAMLLSRMLFEHAKIDLEMNLGDAQRRKLFWLISLQESEFFQKFGPEMRKALDTLIRLDAIHSIRKSLYTDRMRALIAQVRDEIPTEKMLVALCEQVESNGFKILAKKTTPPEGNRQSLNAALAQAGILPWQIRMRENEAKQKTESLAFAARVVEKMKLNDLERIKEGYAERHTAVLDDLGNQIPALLRQKYENAIRQEEEAKAKAKASAESKSKPKVSKSSIKAANRFGDLDFSL